MNWINVNDKLPDEYQWVLVKNCNGEDFEPTSTMAQYRDCYEGCCDFKFRCVEASGCVPYISDHDVRLWMPLP